MEIKLFLDEDIHFPLALALRKRGYDVVHVQEMERKGESDAEQLKYAVENKRCLISFNVKDFVLLHSEYIMKKKTHFGILVSKQLPVREVLNKILIKLQLYSHESMQNTIDFL